VTRGAAGGGGGHEKRDARPSEPAAPGVHWLSGASLRLHVGLFAGLALCALGCWVEWRRAFQGHQAAWVYSVEWPLFALMGTYVWWRLLHDHLPGRTKGAAGPPAGRQPREVPLDDGQMLEDPGLAAWQAYLDRLHAVDPPGGPPVAGPRRGSSRGAT